MLGKVGISDADQDDVDAVAADLSIGSQLCIQCGLCCTGALHNFAVLDEDEIEFARSLGLTLRTEGRPGFTLPCHYLNGCSCSIYASRPRVCGRYACQLLDGVRDGEVAMPTAIKHVRTAKRMYEDVLTMLPPGTSFPQGRQLLVHAPDPGQSDQDRAGEMRLRLALTALCLYLDKHFKNSRESRLLTMTPADEELEGKSNEL